jgi:hypothetical protein
VISAAVIFLQEELPLSINQCNISHFTYLLGLNINIEALLIGAVVCFTIIISLFAKYFYLRAGPKGLVI